VAGQDGAAFAGFGGSTDSATPNAALKDIRASRRTQVFFVESICVFLDDMACALLFIRASSLMSRECIP
jgi:hypothetical protein